MRRRLYNGFSRRRGLSGGKVAFLTLLFWAVSGLIMITFLHGGPGHLIEAKGEDVAKMYIGNVFPTISRSSEARESIGGQSGIPGAYENGKLDNDKKGLLTAMVDSMFPAADVLNDDLAEEDHGTVLETDSDKTGESGITTPNKTPAVETQNQDSPEPAAADIDYTKPVVIIYHTHATESYQPVSDGNFHSLKEAGTVREVGDVLTAALEAKGIQVIHDKTIHDSPSYNESYTRSLETVQKLMAKYTSAKIIIDLHRDAASYSGNVGKTVAINKQTVAKYNLVVGSGNANVEALKVFANKVNNKAEALYPGFGGNIIEKQHRFNEYVSDYDLLLEIGNNQNTIDQAKLTGKYFADVLAAVIKDIE